MAEHSALMGAWEARNTTVNDVERQLGRIIRELNRPPGGGNGDADDPRAYPPPRASVLNLLVHADEEGEAQRAADLMAMLATRHPSRTLLLIAEPDAPADGLDATISTQCLFRPGSAGHLCFERVQLTARGATALHLASVAEPLLISNLPVFVWWLGRAPGSRDPLLELCDRLIVDSADFPDAPAGLSALDACVAAAESRLELGDLGWRRSAPWRQLIAQFFDPPDARAYQRMITQVEIEYVPMPSRTVGAAPLLLVGWLASRLDWEPEVATSARGTLDVTFAPDRRSEGHSGSGVGVRVRPRAVAGAEPGDLLAVTLRAGPEATAATFEVRWAQTCTSASTRAVLPGVREVTRQAPLARASPAELLAGELELTVADAVYADSLGMVARLVR